MRIILALALCATTAACNGAIEQDLGKTNRQLDGFEAQTQESLGDHAEQLQSLEARVYTDAMAVAAMGPKNNGNPHHHDRYTDGEAVTAMGMKSDDNPLNHDRYTDAEAVAAMGVRADDNPHNHSRYTDAEALEAMGTKANANPLHHDRYTNSEAVAAMGTKSNTNALHHDRYSDTEAVAAVDAAGFMRIPVEVLMFEDHFETGITGLWTHTGGTTATTTTTPNASSPWTDYLSTGTNGMLLNEAEILSRDFDEPGPAHVSAYFYDNASDASARAVIYVWGSTGQGYVAVGVYAPGISTTHYAFSDQYGSWQPTDVARRTGWHRVDIIADTFRCKGYIDDHLVFETRRADMRTISALSVAQDAAGELMSGGFIVDDVVVSNVQ